MPANDISPAPTVYAAWTAFLEYYRLRATALEITDSTVAVYENLRGSLGELADTRIDLLTKPAVWKWLAKFGQEPSIRTGRPRPTQGNAVRHVLGLVCNYAELCGWRPEGTNPVRGVPRYKSKKRERYLSIEECPVFFRALAIVESRRTTRRFREPLRNVALYSPTRLILALYLSGRRYTSVARLKKTDVDLDDAHGQPHKRPVMRCQVKGKGIRSYPVAPPLAELFRRQRVLVGELSPYLFPSASKRGWFLSVAGVWEEVREVGQLRGLVLHGLRHTAACQLLLHGVDRKDVARFLDDDQAVLDRFYDHIQITPTHRQAVDRGSQILLALLHGEPVDDGYRPPRTSRGPGKGRRRTMDLSDRVANDTPTPPNERLLKVRELWAQLAGPAKDFREHTYPAELVGPTLTVHVDSSQWVRDLESMKVALLERLVKLAPDLGVKSLLVRLADLPATSPASTYGDHDLVAALERQGFIFTSSETPAGGVS